MPSRQSRSSSPRMRAAHLHEVEHLRQVRLHNFTDLLKENELTYLKFGFKTEERQENIYIKEFQKSMNIQKTGTMNISDLWSNKQINRFLDIQHFTKDKFLLQKLSKQRQSIQTIRIHHPSKEILPVRVACKRKTLKQIIDDINTIHEENIQLKQMLAPRKLNNTPKYF